MKERRALISLNLCLLMLFNCLCPTALAAGGTDPGNGTTGSFEPAVVASGLCGAGVSWSLNTEGALTISGSGSMEDYDHYDSAPWYSHRSSITALTVEYGVTAIGRNAFSACNMLEQVSFPDGLTRIGEQAFAQCYNLQSITLPAGLAKIESHAFSGCQNLSSIFLPHGLETIGSFAFSSCRKLQSISLPDSLLTLERYAFQDCTGLVSVKFGGALIEIPYYAFENCDNLTSVIVPDNIRHIGQNAFYSCDSLTSVYIGSGIQTIGYHAFSGCNTLTQVSVNQYEVLVSTDNSFSPGATVTYKAVETEGAVKTWNVGVRKETDATATLYGDGRLVIEGTGGFKKANWPSSITAVEIADTITAMPRDAFAECTKLTHIVIGSGISEISDCAFYNCKNLQSITLPAGLTEIGDQAFYGCENLQDFALPAGLTVIGIYAFSGCGSLQSIMLPDSLLTMGYGAFSECAGLKSVTFGTGLREIPSSAFYNCDKLTDLSFAGKNITHIGDSAFGDCDALTQIYILPGIQSIGYRAFYGCDRLTQVDISSHKLLVATNESFPEETTVTWNYTVPGKVIKTWYVGAVDPTAAVAELYTDGRLVITGTGAIAEADWAPGTTSIEIGDGITGFSGSTFGSSKYSYSLPNVTKVTIGSGVQYIGEAVFSACRNLETISIDQYELLVTVSTSTSLEILYKTCEDTDVLATWNAGDRDETDVTATLYGDGRLVIDGEGGFKRANWPTGITAVEIADTITAMPHDAFEACTKLTHVVIGSGISEISDYAFSGCTALTDVSFRGDIKHIGAAAFHNCTALERISPGGQVITIGSSAFYGCTALTEVIAYSGEAKDITSKLTAIGDYAFYGCTALKTMLFGDSLETIGNYAFSGSGLISAVTPNAITSIGRNVFANCANLSLIGVGTGLRTLGDEAFANCPKLQHISWDVEKLETPLHADSNIFRGAGSAISEGFAPLTLYIGKRVASIPDYLFYVSTNDPAGAIHLKNIDNYYGNAIPLERVGRFAFYNCAKLENVDLGESLTTIGEGAFNSCSALMSFHFPDTLTTIGRKAFFRTGLTEATLRRGVEEIGDLAFGQCGENFKIIGQKDSFAMDYAMENSIPFQTYKSFLLTLDDNNTVGLFREEECMPDETVSLASYSRTFQKNAEAMVAGIELTGWNTAADGSGTAYATDAAVAVTADITLYAQWNIPFAVIDGTNVPITATVTNDTWQYRWDQTIGRAEITLTDHSGGGITVPGRADIYVNGSCTVSSSAGNAVSARDLRIVLSKDSILTVSSGKDAAAIQCDRLTVIGPGRLSLSTEHAVGISASDSVIYNAAGAATITAAQTAISANVIQFGQAWDFYLSADAEQPAAAYDNGAYIRLEPQSWSATLHANGGAWADQEGAEKDVRCSLEQYLQLALYSQAVSRDGYFLVGWSDEANEILYRTDSPVASSTDLTLYAVWAERVLVVDGQSYDPDTDHTGANWEYFAPTEDAAPHLYLTDYRGGRIYAAMNELTVVCEGSNTVTGAVGEPAIQTLGRLNLAVYGSADITGGAGEHAIQAEGEVWIYNCGKLAVYGGAGGSAIHSTRPVEIYNTGEVTAVGGTLGHALSADYLAIREAGKTIFLSGSPECSALDVRRGFEGNIGPDLKVYAGNNASSAQRCEAYTGHMDPYIRIQPKTIIVNLDGNGGQLPADAEATMELAQSADNTFSLAAAPTPTRSGYAFAGWNTRRDGTGESYDTQGESTAGELVDELQLYAQWEELEFEIVNQEPLTLRLAEELPAETTVLLAVYTQQDQMISVVTGTYANGMWKFDTALPENSHYFKAFFINDQKIPARNYISNGK